MKMEEIEKQLETTDSIEYEGACHDCNEGVTVCIFKDKETGTITIEGGAVYDPLGAAKVFLKCNGCFAKDSILRNWQPCEVYSRIVGYLTPVSGWNRGKVEEYRQRKEFVVEGPNSREEK